MSATWREDLGRICRWALLGLSAAVCLSVGWANLEVLQHLKTPGSHRPIVNDKLLSPRRGETFLSVWQGPEPLGGPSVLAIDAGRPRVPAGRGSIAYLKMTDLSGHRGGRVELVGTPYGPWATRRLVSSWSDVPGRVHVVFVDAPLILDGLVPEAQQIPEDVKLAAVLAGPVDRLDRDARRLESKAPTLPRLVVAIGAWSAAPRFLRKDLQRPGYRRMYFLTGRAELARYWASKGLNVQYIGRDAGASDPAGRIKTWLSVGHFLESLESPALNR
jgi:hypothetical protein